MAQSLAGISGEELEDLLFHCLQGDFLAGGIRRSDDPALSRAGRVIDLRGIVIARAMRRTRDGRGDLCFPGPLAPGPALAFGATPLEYLRHVAQKRTSAAAARAGGESWTDLRRGIVGWSGRPGMMTQVVAGAAIAFARRDHDRAALVFESHLALQSGGWHEGMSLAAARSVPILVVLVARDRALPTGAIARAYGVREIQLRDDSLIGLFRSIREARRQVVREGGPALMALDPFASDRHRTLLADFRARLQSAGVLAPDRIDAIVGTASESVEHALVRIRREGPPEPDDALVAVCRGSAPPSPWTRMRSPDPRGPVAEPDPAGAAHVH